MLVPRSIQLTTLTLALGSASFGIVSGADLELLGAHDLSGTVQGLSANILTIRLDRDDARGSARKGDTIRVTITPRTRVRNGDRYLPGTPIVVAAVPEGTTWSAVYVAERIPAKVQETSRPRPPAPTQQSRGLNFCNKFEETVYAAFAFRQNDDWVTTGWLKVPSNACKYAGVFPNYYYVETAVQKIGAGASVQRHWQGDRRFCVGEAGFEFHHADTRCDARRRKFSGKPDSVIRAIIVEADGQNVSTLIAPMNGQQ